MGHWEPWEHWDYLPSTPRPVKNGIKAKTQRGAIGESWWSKKWIGVLESFGMGARLGRGRSYARRGQVMNIDIEKGVVSARVQGSRPQPYSVEIKLDPIPDRDWDKVITAMASQAIFAAKLLSGEMPLNIEEAFAAAKVPLFPVKGKDLVTKCSCPDWANPCKHVAAVYFLVAERFDEDPFLIFKLRGRDKEEIIKALRSKRAPAAAGAAKTAPMAQPIAAENRDKPLEECLDTFWQAGPALNSFSVNPAPPEVDHPILKRLGDPPFKAGKQDIAVLLAEAYTAASRAAQRQALQGDAGP